MLQEKYLHRSKLVTNTIHGKEVKIFSSQEVIIYQGPYLIRVRELKGSSQSTPARRSNFPSPLQRVQDLNERVLHAKEFSPSWYANNVVKLH